MTSTHDNLSLTFSALADPTRRKMVALLADRDRTVTDLTMAFELSQPAISKHLRVLERAGLVRRGRQAQWRPARLQTEPLKRASDWVEEVRQHWEGSLDSLGEFLGSIEAERS